MMLCVDALGLSFTGTGAAARPALSGISLSVERGEVVGLIGGSGAGKSLVAMALMGSLPRNAIRSGCVTLDHAPIAAGHLALAPQSVDALDPLADVGTQIGRFARLAGRQPDVATLLARVGLTTSVAPLFPHQLSGGMAKRVLLATALATESAFLIADEPTLGLDPGAADDLMACLAGLAEQGKGVLAISHDLPRLVGTARRVIVLNEGEAVETAPAACFAGNGARLSHPFSRALWRAQNGEIAWA
ncbi:MAG: ATP-binding cassette domain-containing protein [Paracoccaceae bacterium]